MKHFKLVLASLAFLGSVSANAQTDVTATYLTNADFSQGTPITVGTCTYAKDAAGNGTQYSQLVPVDGWDIPENGDARAGGLIAFGSGVWIGGPGYTAPATDSDGNSEGNILGLVGVWGGKAQYTQNVTFPAGTYTLVLGVYNSKGGSNAFTKNLIGFIEDGGTEHLATTTVYSINTWKYEFITFTLDAETTGKISLGYQGSNVGSANAQHLFLSGLTLFEGEVDAEAYEAAKEAARNAKELEANKEKLEGSSYSNPSEDLLINGSFDTANQGWTLTNMGYQANQERPTRYVEKWQGSSLTGSGSASQTVKNLPAGAYILKGYVHTNQAEDGGATLNVNGESIPVSGAWTEYEIVYNLEQDGDVTVSFNWSGLNSNWIAIDEFSLVYGGPYDQYIADKEALGPKADWEAALAAAQAALADEANANIGGEELAALQEEIAKAEPTTAEGYNDATAALIAATTTFTNAKAAYDALAAANQMIADAGELKYADQAKKPEAFTAANATEAAANADAVIASLRAYYESHAAAESIDGAVDMTSAITNATDPANNDGWTWTGNKNDPKSNESWTDVDGTTDHSYFDGGNWGANSWTTTMEQTINIPAGKYLLTAKARSAANVTFTMAAAGESVELPHAGNAGNVFHNGWGDASVEFETNGDPVTILVTASSNTLHEWFSISDFRLVQLEEIEVPMADEDDYAALTEAIQPFMNAELGFDEGEYAPYNNVEAILLAEEIANLDEEKIANKEYTKEYIQGLTAAVNATTIVANETEVNAIYDGEFANTEANATSGDINLPGWTKVQGIRLLVKDEATDPGLAYTDGKAAVFSWGGTTLTYGEQTGYTMLLNEGEVYELSFKIAGWRDGDFANVLTVSMDGQTFTINPNVPGKINDAEGNPFADVKFYFTASADVDNSILTIYANHHFAIADLKLMKAVMTDVVLNSTDTAAPERQYAGTITTDRTLLEGLNTIVLPFETTNEEIGAATVLEYTGTTTEADGTITMNFKEVTTLKANVPYAVMLTQEEGENAQPLAFENKEVAPAGNLTVADANYSFVGTYADFGKQNDIVKEGDYIAGANAFKKAKGGNRIAAYRAYMKKAAEVPEGAKIAFNFDGNIVDGIEAVEIMNNLSGNIYNLNGQKMEKAQKGINIINGKKVIVK